MLYSFRIPPAIGGMTHEQLDAELQKGFDSMKTRKCYTPEEIGTMLEAEFGISLDGGDNDA